MKEWPASKLELLPVDSLVPYARNARTHSAEQIEQIARLIDHYGFTQAILIDEKGMILAGHGRVLAAQKRGFKMIPAMRAIGWSETDKRAYILEDNKVTANAGWDADLLKGEIDSLQGAGFDSFVGFSSDELTALQAEGKTNVREIQTSDVTDRFWVSISGPLALQAEVHEQIKKLLADVPKLAIEVGAINQPEF